MSSININVLISAIKVVLIGTLLIFTSSVNSQSITLDFNQSFQTIDRWENGGFIPSGIAPYIIDDVLNLSVDTLGLNRLRLEIRCGAEHQADNYQQYQDSIIDYDTWRSQRYATVNDNDDPFTINEAGFHFTEFDQSIENIIIPFRDRLIQNGSNLYINLCFVAFTDQLNDGTGGTIIHQNPEEYAEFIQATFLHMDSKYGFVPDGVEVILEPNVANFGNGTLVGECLVAAGERLSSIGYHPDFIACSNTNLNGAINFYPSFSAVDGVSNYWKEYSFHAYAARSDANLIQIATNAAQSGVKTSMLEWWANGNTFSFLHDCLRLANVSSYEFKGSFGTPGNDWSSGLLQIIDNGNNNYDLALQNPSKYFRHYFKLIQSGAIRYEATSTDINFDPVVFINPDGNLILNIDAAKSGTVKISDLPLGDYYTVHSLGNGRQEPKPYWEISEIFTIASEQEIDLEIENEGIYSIVQISSPVSNSISQLKNLDDDFSILSMEGQLSITAKGSRSIQGLSIYTSNGTKIISKSYTHSPYINLNTSSFPEGVYFILLNEEYIKKVFIRN